MSVAPVVIAPSPNAAEAWADVLERIRAAKAAELATVRELACALAAAEERAQRAQHDLWEAESRERAVRALLDTPARIAADPAARTLIAAAIAARRRAGHAAAAVRDAEQALKAAGEQLEQLAVHADGHSGYRRDNARCWEHYGCDDATAHALARLFCDE